LSDEDVEYLVEERPEVYDKNNVIRREKATSDYNKALEEGRSNHLLTNNKKSTDFRMIVRRFSFEEVCVVLL